jgi:CheY-like chemotaxis protein
MINVGETQHVLIAEDDEDDLTLFREALKELSLDVVVSHAENGDVLLKILGKALPDVLFLDICMPCKDGKTCLREIRSNPAFDQLPIIIYSSVDDLSTIEHCFREGTNFYMVKPSKYITLVNMLRRIFQVNWKKVRLYPKLDQFVLKE